MVTRIVIATLNTKAWTSACVRSVVRDENTPPDTEIVVVDSGTDGTADHLRRFYLHNRPGKAIHWPDHPLPYPKAANLGAAEPGEWDAIVFLNSDTLVTHGWLEMLTAPFADDPRLGATGPVSNMVKGMQMHHVGTHDYTDEATLREFAIRHRAQTAGVGMWKTHFLSGFCLAIRREAWEDVGPFDERFDPGNFDDDDWCRRAVAKGWGLKVVPWCFVHHVGGQTFRANGMDYGSAMQRCMKKFQEKWSQEGAAS